MSFADGVYFGLEEDAYHADDALGSTDIKNLIMGPEIYWANTPMNPLYEPKETKATLRGDAYHKLILEGREAFEAAFIVGPQKIDYPNALFTVEEIKEALKALDQKTSGRKADLIDRLLEANPKAMIWDVIMEQFLDAHPDQRQISQQLLEEITYASRFILANPHLRDAFAGGFPEVSIFWTVDDIRRKARIDYLKPAVAVDLKTYSNIYGARADVAIHTAAARNGHDLQAAWYRPGLKAAKHLPFLGDAAPDADWERAFREAPECQTYFVYQAADKIPMARGKWMDYRLQTFKIAEIQCENAVQTYASCRDQFGIAPWIIPEKPSAFEDEGFPMYRR